MIEPWSMMYFRRKFTSDGRLLEVKVVCAERVQRGPYTYGKEEHAAPLPLSVALYLGFNQPVMHPVPWVVLESMIERFEEARTVICEENNDATTQR